MAPRMFYSERGAYARMTPPRRLLHRVIRGAYFPLAWFPPFRRAWAWYRGTWP